MASSTSTSARFLCVAFLAACSDSSNSSPTDAGPDARGGDAPRATDGPRAPDAPPATADAPAHAVDAPLHAIDGPIGSIDAPSSTADAPAHAIDAPSHPDAPNVPPYPDITLGLQQVATGFSSPTVIVMPPGEARYFIAEKTGTVSIVENGSKRATPFIDMTTLAKLSTDGEEGLLGLAFHPDYATNGRVFVYWTGDYLGTPDSSPRRDCHVWEFHRGDDASMTDGTHKVILDVDHPDTNHNGGNIRFGPDGKLYIGIGDGGGGGGIYGTTRILTTRLSKILRIDVDDGDPYQAPPDNPFASMDDAAAKDIWVYGLRNPWRWSFDRQTGDLWIGDVGQELYEEIDFIPAGHKGNDLQWNLREGFHCYPPTNSTTDPDIACPVPGGGTPPVSEYSHSESGGNAIVGGYVYRGDAIPELKGMYFFSDNSGGFIRSFWGFAPVPFAQTKNWSALHQSNVSTFGESPDGDLLFCSITQGKCWQIVKN